MSAYLEMHKADWVPIHYDTVIYDPGSYDTFIWELQKPVLRSLMARSSEKSGGARYLDFACGTGRIIAAIEDLVGGSFGIDTSPQMATYAQAGLSRSTVVCGDLLADRDLVPADFDVITAFRFFYNTEPDVRVRVMRALAQHLAGPEARLIFNVHANATSTDSLTSAYKRVRGWGQPTTTTYGAVQRLVEGAGLEIEACYGFGLWPHRVYRSRLAGFAKWLDRHAATRGWLRWASHDLVFVCRPARVR